MIMVEPRNGHVESSVSAWDFGNTLHRTKSQGCYQSSKTTADHELVSRKTWFEFPGKSTGDMAGDFALLVFKPTSMLRILSTYIMGFRIEAIVICLKWNSAGSRCASRVGSLESRKRRTVSAYGGHHDRVVDFGDTLSVGTCSGNSCEQEKHFYHSQEMI